MEGIKKVPNFAAQLRQEGRLAQLVQSVCLTSRGSAVRIRQRPQLHLMHAKFQPWRGHNSRTKGDPPVVREFLGTVAWELLEKSMQGRLAQLVQSVCLTSRGSAVRIRQRPHSSHARQVSVSCRGNSSRNKKKTSPLLPGIFLETVA